MEKPRENKQLFSSLECQRSGLQDSNLIRAGETAPWVEVFSLLQPVQSSALLQGLGAAAARGCWYVLCGGDVLVNGGLQV